MAELRISKNEIARWNRLLSMESIDYDKEGLSGDPLADWTVEVDSDVFASLNIYAVPDGNQLWCEVNWWNTNGFEIGSSESSRKRIDGAWKCMQNPKYSIMVVVENEN